MHDISDAEKQCACGAQLSRIGEETCEKLDYVPAKLQVIRHIRPKYACKACEGVEDDGPTVKIASACGATDSQKQRHRGAAGAYRRLKIRRCASPAPPTEDIQPPGLSTSQRPTMANWMIQAAGGCQPIIELLQQEIRSGPVINIDESPFQVLKEPGRSDTSKSYMWVFCGGPLDAPAVCIPIPSYA